MAETTANHTWGPSLDSPPLPHTSLSKLSAPFNYSAFTTAADVRGTVGTPCVFPSRPVFVVLAVGAKAFFISQKWS